MGSSDVITREVHVDATPKSSCVLTRQLRNTTLSRSGENHKGSARAFHVSLRRSSRSAWAVQGMLTRQFSKCVGV
jgi:hypothetical protein